MAFHVGLVVVLFFLELGIKSVVESQNVICPDQSQCLQGTTCCEMVNGKYGCCPLINAVCCEDKKHCCPSGSKCDLVRLRCVSMNSLGVFDNSKEISPFPILPSISVNSQSTRINCGNKAGYSCLLNTTCCPLPFSQDSCCPIPNGECCSDFLHCCPEKFVCDIKMKSCVKDDEIIPWFLQMPLLHFQKDIKEITQERKGLKYLAKLKYLLQKKNSNAKSSNICSANETTCNMDNNYYGCCPLTEAICCSDKLHCCPSNTECDVDTGTCRRGIDIDDLLVIEESPFHSLKRALIAQIKSQNKSNIVPDTNLMCHDKTLCDDNDTCCLVGKDKFGCCPYPQGVCCTDLLHCCPHGTRCDPKVGCRSVTEFSNTFHGKLLQQQINEAEIIDDTVVCPDKKHQCGDGNTCCLLSSGSYGCCPHPNAVCCQDKVHCCPNGYTCDLQSKSCIETSGMPLLSKLENIQLKEIIDDTVVCPDKKHRCGDGTTCCLLSSGSYGCCPYPNAVCCQDKEHCCPNGYTCDLKTKTCIETSGMSVLSKLEKSELKEIIDDTVVCPDKKHRCGDGTTCCLLSSGSYGCCPYPNAVCCQDKEHCCPNGYTCDLKTKTCIETSGMSLLSKLEKSKLKEIIDDTVVCPDKKHRCGDGTTCCLLSSGSYGCCPYPNAVCCQDKEHCCPNGYTCDLKTKTCIETSGMSVLSKLEKSELKETSEVAVVCPDKKHRCGDGTTCCLLSSGSYGCCPYPNAVCCQDKEHCCPNGYTCDLKTKTCIETSGMSVLSKLEKSELKEIIDDTVVCPDKKHRCGDGTTCCLLSSGSYGCCPYPNAVCCQDKEHCCPNGYTCDLKTKTCIEPSGMSLLSKLEKSELKEIIDDTVVCPDKKHQCGDGTTCCLLSSGSYGCCPYSNAVCCQDKEHCCPNGYTCDLKTKTCIETSVSSSSLLSKLEKTKLKEIVCPGGNFTCPTDFTCCALKSGEFGCCQWREAVCCEDGLHCCPHKTVCELETEQCLPVINSIPWGKKTKAEKIPVDVEEITSKLDNSFTNTDTNFYSQAKPSIAQTDFIKDFTNSTVEIVCPGGAYRCPSGNTCCRMFSGKWGCCHAAFATCCDDGRHCCPHNYRCTSDGRCIH